MEANRVKRRKPIRVIFGPLLLGSTLAASSPTLPRQSPELSINDLSGKATMLSSFRGKVVVLEFLFVKSQHCLRVAQVLNQLQQELGPRGLQPVGIAFDAPNATTTGGEYLNAMVQSLRLTYPVGYAQRAAVDAYLGRSANDMLSIPQIVVIDRTGTIRAATGGQTDPSLEDINALRVLLEPLLKESAAPNSKSKT
jgi:peroxiredoxin